MFRRLLDPEETARRRRVRARIVRRNRIQRERAQGLEPQLRRIPKPKDRTIHDYGWDPLHADDRGGGGALGLLSAAFGGGGGGEQPPRLRTPPVMSGVERVAPRHARDKRPDSASAATASTMVNDPTSPHAAVQPADNAGPRPPPALSSRPRPVGPARPPSRPTNAAARERWRRWIRVVLIRRHEEILGKDPNRPWRQMRLGLLYFDRGEFAKASTCLTKALTLGQSGGLCWRRLAQCHIRVYDETQDWGVLWDARSALEQCLAHVEMACNPYVLADYARVLEALGSYHGALAAYASILSTFPRFAQRHEAQFRFVLLQRHALSVHGGIDGGSGAMDVDEQERVLLKSLELTKALLLDKSITDGPPRRYFAVLYIHGRLNELLLATGSPTRKGDNVGLAARVAAQGSADLAFAELFKLAVGLQLVIPGRGVSWRTWRAQKATYTRLADHFQQEHEGILASDALSRAMELMQSEEENEKVAKPSKQSVPPQPETTPTADKIALHLVMARNFYDANQMERAIRAMEIIFQLNPYLDEVRQSLAEWFPAKWKDRLELEDASQVQIARVLRGIRGRRVASTRRREAELAALAQYRAQPYHPRCRRAILRLQQATLGPVFAAQELAARTLQRQARTFLRFARIRWALEAEHERHARDLRGKYHTRKYRYNRQVRFHLTQLDPEGYETRFRREEASARLVQRWFRGERVRVGYRALLAARAAARAHQDAAATCIQRAQRRYRQRVLHGSEMSAAERLFMAQVRLQQAQERLARVLQRLFRHGKDRIVLLTRISLRRQQRHRDEELRQRSAARIQRAWRRVLAVREGRGRLNEARFLLDQLQRGHDRLFAEAAAASSRSMESSARKIQALYRGKRIRASLVNLRRVPAPAMTSPVLDLLGRCDRAHAKGSAGDKRVVLARLETIAERRALFDYPVVVLRADPSQPPLPLEHVASAIQHSALLRTLILDGGDYRSPRAESIFRALQTSTTLRVLALHRIHTAARVRRHRRSSVRNPEEEAAAVVNSSREEQHEGPTTNEEHEDEDEEDDNESDDDEDAALATTRQLMTADSPRRPMEALSAALRTRNFLLEELYLERCGDLVRRERDAALLAGTLGDYFYGRYGRLRVLAVVRMGLSDAGGGRLGDALSINTVLRYLDVHGNHLRDDAATAIARKGLAANASLVYLNLAENEIGSAGARALFGALETGNRTLETLILCTNHIMNDAIGALHRALQANAVITCVDLRGNLIHEEHLAELERAFAERLGTQDEELRLFLARRRFNSTSGGGLGGAPLSPLQRGKRNKRGAQQALSPHKWIKAQRAQAPSPLLRFPFPQRSPTHRAEELASDDAEQRPPPIDALLLGPAKVGNAKGKSPATLPRGKATRLPNLPLSPGRADSVSRR